MRFTTTYDLSAMLVLLIIAGGCRGGASSANSSEEGARLSVFVPSANATLAKESVSGITAHERLVIRDVTEWPAMWARIHGAQNPPPPIVQPDFATEMAVVAAMGEKASGGFDIVIDSVTRHERGSIVYVTEHSPGSGCMTTGALSQPVHAVRAPKTDGTIWWREGNVVDNC